MRAIAFLVATTIRIQGQKMLVSGDGEDVPSTSFSLPSQGDVTVPGRSVNCVVYAIGGDSGRREAKRRVSLLSPGELGPTQNPSAGNLLLHQSMLEPNAEPVGGRSALR